MFQNAETMTHMEEVRLNEPILCLQKNVYKAYNSLQVNFHFKWRAKQAARGRSSEQQSREGWESFHSLPASLSRLISSTARVDFVRYPPNRELVRGLDSLQELFRFIPRILLWREEDTVKFQK